jgi:recombination protein RecT
MTDQPAPQPSKAVAQRRAPSALERLLGEHESDLAAIMPRHANAETFMGLALSAVRKSPKLIEATKANPGALILALRECAYLGHVVTRKQFYLVPFDDKNAPGHKTIVGIEAWQGAVQRIYRAGGVESVKVNVGREGDPVLRFNPTRMDLPQHEYDEFMAPADRGQLKVAYAWAVMPGGVISQVAWLPPHEIARRRASSRSGSAFWGPPPPAPEGPNTEAMWRKSAVLALLDMVPISAEYLADANRRAVAAERGRFAGFDYPVTQPSDTEPVWDGEVVDE